MMNQQVINFAEDDLIRELLHQYQPVILRMKATYYVRDMTDDDWLQEGMIVLHKCSLSYQSTMGTSFGMYFKQSFQHRIFSLLRKQAAFKRQAETNAVSYELLTQENGQEYFDQRKTSISEDIIARLIVKETIENFPSFCSKTEREVLSLYLMNQSITEITTELQRTNRAVRMAYNRAVNKIREEIH